MAPVWLILGAFAAGALVAGLVLAARQRRASAARDAADAQRAALASAQSQLKDSFAALSKDALKDNREEFLSTAVDLLKPVRESLDRVQTQLAEVDKHREGSFRDVAARLGRLDEAHDQLRRATEGLTRSLRSPNVRGRWGEIQLRHVVELAGMVEHVDFEEQIAAGTADDARVKPDMIVRLPGESYIIIDAKVPIDGYLRATEATDDAARSRGLDDHAQQVKAHIRALGSKKYWDAFAPSPEFVVMFLPLEPLLSAAFEREPALFDLSVRERVVLATPITLLALLRAVAFGWQQHAIARNTEAIRDAGRELCDRLVKMLDHIDRVGGGLHDAMKAYNETVASFNARVMPSVKRFQDLKVPSADALVAPTPHDIERRDIMRPTLPGLDPDETPEPAPVASPDPPRR